MKVYFSMKFVNFYFPQKTFFIPCDNSSPCDSNWFVLNVHGLKVPFISLKLFYCANKNLPFPQWYMQPSSFLAADNFHSGRLAPLYITWLLCEFYFCNTCNSYLILLPLQSFRNSMWHTFKNTVPNDPVSFFLGSHPAQLLAGRKWLREFLGVILLQNTADFIVGNWNQLLKKVAINDF